MRKLLFICAALMVGAVQGAVPHAPFKVEVTHSKTTHILFPAEVRYVDLGSRNIVAGVAAGAGNVVRVKAAVQGFEGETNLSVITADGNFYTFDARYVEQPSQISLDVSTQLREGLARLSELGDEPAAVTERVMSDIYRRNRRDMRGIASREFGVKAAMRGIYVHDDLIYLHFSLTNPSNVAFDIDFVRFRIADKKVARRTAIQESEIAPVRAHNDVRQVRGRSSCRHVFAFEKFTIPDNKVLLVEIFERGGGRHQTLQIESRDLLSAKIVNHLSTE